MKLPRPAHDPAALLEFYSAALVALGAVCDRTWHDRLAVLAEDRAAGLWNKSGDLHEIELHFASADAASARDAEREIFPGCPLTFHLAEALRPSPLTLERFVIPGEAGARPPDPTVAEKRWRLQFPESSRWRLDAPFRPAHHFTLLALIRCEIQAIDQHWSVHRVAISLPGGSPDDDLGRELAFHASSAASHGEIDWPRADPAAWNVLIKRTLESELACDLARVRARQEHSLRREVERIDAYFENYGHELASRSTRVHSESAKEKTASRLAAARAEHARRRADQIARHEIRVMPRIDSLLLVAEPAWVASVRVERARQSEAVSAHFIPRSRRWELTPANPL